MWQGSAYCRRGLSTQLQASSLSFKAWPWQLDYFNIYCTTTLSLLQKLSRTTTIIILGALNHILLLVVSCLCSVDSDVPASERYQLLSKLQCPTLGSVQVGFHGLLIRIIQKHHFYIQIFSCSELILSERNHCGVLVVPTSTDCY